MNKNLLSRITLNPKVCKGKPTIRNMRFTVAQMLGLMAGRLEIKEILADCPYIEKKIFGLVFFMPFKNNWKKPLKD